MPEIKQPLLIANPDLIFDKYFNLNFKTITSYYGVDKLIGNKKEQENIDRSGSLHGPRPSAHSHTQLGRGHHKEHA